MTIRELSPQAKRELYTSWLQSMHDAKIEETKKKIARYGYTDEDDYHFLVPPENYAWKPVGDTPNGDFHGYRGWSENYRDMVASFPPVVVPQSAMAGNFHRILQKFRKLRWHQSWDLSPYQALIDRYGIDHGLGQMHHFCGDMRIALALGWGGLREKVERYAALNRQTEEQREFYRAELLFLDTCIGWIDRTIACIREKAAAETDPLLKDNLENMLRANEAVRLSPPATLREACQTISWYNIFGRSFNREGAGGQLDEVLRPYYERDTALGLIDDEDAVFYIGGLLMSDTKYYQLGGPDESGRDMVSRVSWLILEAADRLNVAANLTVRVHDGLPEDFFRRCVALLFKHKNGWPRFSGDQSLVDGFVRRGFTPELARRRIAVGCNWMAIPGVEYPLNDSIKVNMAKVFEVALREMFASGERSVARLHGLYRRHLSIVLQVIADTTDMHLRLNHENNPELFLNLMSVGPVETGRDASDHSMQYYNIGVDGSGVAVAADSFAALETCVENDRTLTWAQVEEALASDFEGTQGCYVQAVLKAAPKFGQWNSLGERWVRTLCGEFADLVIRQRAKEGEIFIPGMFSWSKTILFGKLVGATPDGRKAGSQINHGANPMPGSVPNGAMTTLSEAILAAQCGMGNTSPFQMELDPGITADEGGVEKVIALLRTHLQRGGTLINVNIVDADTIRAAHRQPELYPDLVVRVTGFTAYFITLSPEFRQLVVDRIVSANAS
ncbi:MAG: formate acetyltransferase [Clostridiales bacterium]|nr:formate acetyltransferase [Clostridiales bacterium]